MPTIRQITDTLEIKAPLALQEDYDNCGLLTGTPDAECTGVLLTVDVTPAIVKEAADNNCNLIVAHHPIIFKGLKHLNDNGSAIEQSVIAAIRNNIAIYACHTSMDAATEGVSHEMAKMLNLEQIKVLDPSADATTGLGAIGRLGTPVTARKLVDIVKEKFESPIARCSAFPMDQPIETVAMCGGSGSFLIRDAIAKGAQAFITSDTKYHDFVDYSHRILIIDIGHHESENCTKRIFYHVIKEKFPNFAVRYSEFDKNPIIYL